MSAAIISEFEKNICQILQHIYKMYAIMKKYVSIISTKKFLSCSYTTNGYKLEVIICKLKLNSLLKN